MAQSYRDVAINQMIATTEEAMSHAIDWWGDLPTSMKEAIDEFRVQLGATIDSVEFVKRALDRSVPETCCTAIILIAAQWPSTTWPVPCLLLR
jgi:hypothetical protein